MRKKVVFLQLFHEFASKRENSCYKASKILHHINKIASREDEICDNHFVDLHQKEKTIATGRIKICAACRKKNAAQHTSCPSYLRQVRGCLSTLAAATGVAAMTDQAGQKRRARGVRHGGLLPLLPRTEEVGGEKFLRRLF